MRHTAQRLLSIAIAFLSTASCSSSTEPGAKTIQLYKNGFLYSWNSIPLLVSNGNGVVIDKQASATNNVNGDGSVLSATSINTSPCISVGCLVIVEPSSTTRVNVASYYANGHLQFDIKLGAGNSITNLVLTGSACMASGTDQCASQQSGTLSLSPANYSTSAFTHVSIAIASLFPPSSISTTVPVPFSIKVFGAGVIYLDDIKWTTD